MGRLFCVSQNNFLDYYVAYLRDLPECIALVHVVALKEVSLSCPPDHPLARNPRTRLWWGVGPGRGSAGEGSGCSLPLGALSPGPVPPQHRPRGSWDPHPGHSGEETVLKGPPSLGERQGDPLSSLQGDEEIKSDIYTLFFHIVQRIPEYLIHLQVRGSPPGEWPLPPHPEPAELFLRNASQWVFLRSHGETLRGATGVTIPF